MKPATRSLTNRNYLFRNALALTHPRDVYASRNYREVLLSLASLTGRRFSPDARSFALGFRPAALNCSGDLFHVLNAP